MENSSLPQLIKSLIAWRRFLAVMDCPALLDQIVDHSLCLLSSNNSVKPTVSSMWRLRQGEHRPTVRWKGRMHPYWNAYGLPRQKVLTGERSSVSMWQCTEPLTTTRQRRVLWNYFSIGKSEEKCPIIPCRMMLNKKEKTSFTTITDPVQRIHSWKWETKSWWDRKRQTN